MTPLDFGGLTTPALFWPYRLKDALLRNRIAVAPVCSQAAVDGRVSDQHLMQLGARAVGGAALVVAEGTAVLPDGRISPASPGLWNSDLAEAWARIVPFVRAHGAVPGVQLVHAGRKTLVPPAPQEAMQLPARAFGGNLPRPPHTLSSDDIQAVQDGFTQAARHALDAGFEWLELQFGHGHLAQRFFSPRTNRRQDRWGSGFEGRARFMLETLAAVRAVWPERLPLSARLGISDTLPQGPGHSVEESIELIAHMRRRGLDMVHVSLAMHLPDPQAPPWGPGFLVPIADKVRRSTSLPVAVSWMLDEPARANSVVRDQQADLLMLEHGTLTNPHWAWLAADSLGCSQPWSEGLQPTRSALRH